MTDRSKIVQRAQRRKKLDAVEKFGGKCCICGYGRCPNALEFHHVEGKKEKPSYVVMRWSWERAKVELEKCILVCANCHREIHYHDLNIDIQKLVRPFLSKECDLCGKSFDTKREDQKFCSSACSATFQHNKQRPSKELLTELLDQKISWTRLGEMFDVSDNAVRKWARKYGLM